MSSEGAEHGAEGRPDARHAPEARTGPRAGRMLRSNTSTNPERLATPSRVAGIRSAPRMISPATRNLAATPRPGCATLGSCADASSRLAGRSSVVALPLAAAAQRRGFFRSIRDSAATRTSATTAVSRSSGAVHAVRRVGRRLSGDGTQPDPDPARAYRAATLDRREQRAHLRRPSS